MTPAKRAPEESSREAPGETAHLTIPVVDEDRLLRRAVVVAALLHVALFLAPLPRPEETEVAAPLRRVFVMQPHRFRPPDPERPVQLPEHRARRVPVPDPTPDDPEPLRAPEPERFDLAVAEPLGFEIPEAPLPPSALPDDAPIRLPAGVPRPRRIAGLEPQYTEAARRARIQGAVVIEAVIGVDGRVRDVVVLEPLPMGLSESAVRAVEGWVYEPVTREGHAVAVILDLRVQFTLR